MSMIDWHSVFTRLGYASEKDMWEDLYVTRHLSMSELAQRFGVSGSSIKDALLRVGIETRRRGGPNRGPDPRWPETDAFLQEVDEYGAVHVAERLGFSYSAVYKRARALRKKLSEEN